MSVNPLSIKAGTELYEHTHETWTLLDPAEDGVERVFEADITFDQPFAQTPVVHVGLAGVDAHNGDNLRVRLEVGAIAPTGFKLRVKSWLGTRLWSVQVSWLAMG